MLSPAIGDTTTPTSPAALVMLLEPAPGVDALCTQPLIQRCTVMLPERSKAILPSNAGDSCTVALMFLLGMSQACCRLMRIWEPDLIGVRSVTCASAASNESPTR